MASLSAPNIKNLDDISQPQKASIIDLFCGAGGLSHGFKLEGFNITAGIDSDEACRFPFELNNSAPFTRYDINQLKPEDLNSMFMPSFSKILIGCAPCQLFSTYNQNNKDPKWSLLEVFADLIIATKPDIISMENVPRLLNFRGGEVFDNFVRKIEGAGYFISKSIVYAPDYGVPQTRSRLVLLGSLHGYFELGPPTHVPAEYPTVADTLRGLPPLEAGGVDKQDPIHCASTLSAKNMARIKESKPGGTWKDWKQDLVADCHRSSKGSTYISVYGRMAWDSLSPTITTQFYGFGNGRFGHPEQDRALSLREGALLQTFPDTYKFVPPGDPVYMKVVGRMIGNAVPVNLARAIARAISAHLKDIEND